MLNQNDFLILLLSAFAGGFAASLNKKTNKKGITFLQFVSDVVLNSVSGSILGALSTLIVPQVIIIWAIAALGGLFGKPLIKVVANRILKKILPVTKDESDNDKFLL